MSLPVILAIFLLILLWVVLAKPDRLARFWSFPNQQKTNKHPTIEDIRRKYPKRLSQEQLRKQARAKDEAEARRKQEIIDRNIQQIRSSQEALRDRQEDHQRKVDAMRAAKSGNRQQAKVVLTKSRDISTVKFRQLTKMVNGQQDVARRLIEGNLKLFPDKTPDWACDKAISDLERDRRA